MNRSGQRRHEQGRGSPLSGDIAQRNHQSSVVSFYEVVIVTADFVTRKTDALKFVAGNHGRCSRLKTLLNLHRQLQFALEPLLLETRFDEPRILNSDRSDGSKRGQHFEMVFSETAFRDWRVGIDDYENFF